MPGTSSQQSQTDDQSNSVPNVTPRYRLGASLNGVPVESTNIKCSECKIVTPTDWLMVIPIDTLGIESQVDLAPKAKRLSLCTNCGTIRLTK